MSDGRIKDPAFLQRSTPGTQVRLLLSKMIRPLIYDLAQVMLVPEITALTAEAGGGAPANARRFRFEARRATRTVVPSATAIAGDVDVATSGVATDPSQNIVNLNAFAGEVIVNFRASDSTAQLSVFAGNGTALSGNNTDRLRVLTTNNGLANIQALWTPVGTLRVTWDVEDRPSLDIRYIDLGYL